MRGSGLRSSSRCLLVDASGLLGLASSRCCRRCRCAPPAGAAPPCAASASLGLASAPLLLALASAPLLLGSAPLAPSCSCSGSSSRCRDFVAPLLRSRVCESLLYLSMYVAPAVALHAAGLGSVSSRWRRRAVASAPLALAGLGSAPLRSRRCSVSSSWRRAPRWLVPCSAPSISELVLYLCMFLELAPCSSCWLASWLLALRSRWPRCRRAVASVPSIWRRARLGSVFFSSRWRSSVWPRLVSAPLLAGWLAPARLGSARLGSSRAVPCLLASAQSGASLHQLRNFSGPRRASESIKYRSNRHVPHPFDQDGPHGGTAGGQHGFNASSTTKPVINTL